MTTEAMLEITTEQIAGCDESNAGAICINTVAHARRRSADYLSRLGISDPEVQSRMSGLFVRRAMDQLSLGGDVERNHRLTATTLELTDAYVQKWIIGVEKQIDLHGGMSRCGEIAVKMPALLKKQPRAIESVESAIAFFKVDASLSMPAQPPNNPTNFADQPLTASSGGIVSEVVNFVMTSLRSLFVRSRQRELLGLSLDRRVRQSH